MTKRAEDPDEGNADFSASPIGRHKPQDSNDFPAKSQLIGTASRQARSFNSVFQSIKSPPIINKN